MKVGKPRKQYDAELIEEAFLVPGFKTPYSCQRDEANDRYLLSSSRGNAKFVSAGNGRYELVLNPVTSRNITEREMEIYLSRAKKRLSETESEYRKSHHAPGIAQKRPRTVFRDTVGELPRKKTIFNENFSRPKKERVEIENVSGMLNDLYDEGYHYTEDKTFPTSYVIRNPNGSLVAELFPRNANESTDTVVIHDRDAVSSFRGILEKHRKSYES